MSRNVEALESLIADCGTDRSDRNLAELLAARGVLCVDSLTNAQGAGVLAVSVRDPQSLRAALRRCATGEPPE